MRCRERRGNSRLLDPYEAVAAARHHPVADSRHDAEAGTEVQLVQFARGARVAVSPQIFELPRIRVEDRDLIVRLDRGEVERIAEARVDGQPVVHPPVVLDEILLNVRAVSNLLLLEID